MLLLCSLRNFLCSLVVFVDNQSMLLPGARSGWHRPLSGGGSGHFQELQLPQMEDLVFDRTPQPDASMCCPVSIDVFSSGVASSLTARCHMATTATGQRISPRSTLRMVPRILGGCAERQFSAYSNTVSMILSLNVLSA